MPSLLRFKQLQFHHHHHHHLRCSSNKLGFGIRSIATTCRAVLLPRFGGADVLELRDNVHVPDLKSNEVLVRARAVSVNPLDTRMRAGYGRSLFASLLPLIMGRDVSGEVAAVGDSVQTHKVGQEVFGALHPTAVRGTYADYAILSEDQLTQKPTTISHVEATAIPFAALTTWRALKSTARITKGYVCGTYLPSFQSVETFHMGRSLHPNNGPKPTSQQQAEGTSGGWRRSCRLLCSSASSCSWLCGFSYM